MSRFKTGRRSEGRGGRDQPRDAGRGGPAAPVGLTGSSLKSNELFVRNPHSILAALHARPKDVLEIAFPKDASEGVWQEIEAVAHESKVRTRTFQPDNSTRSSGMGRESSHGALMRPKTPISVEEIFDGVDVTTRGVWLALDSLQDPQNLGAIFRAAAFFGARGLILTSERSAPMTSTVYDIASGGVEAVPFVPVINLQRAFEKAKDAGMWILGTSEHAKQPIEKIERDRPWLVVVGNEEKGMRRLTEEACDMTCSILPRGKIVTSLNVSVAAGVLLSRLS